MIWNYKPTIYNLKSAILNLKSLTLFLSIGLILYGTASLQPLGAGTQITPAEVLEQLQAKAETLRNLQGNFEQRKFSRLLINPVESTGKFSWQPPGRFRWEVVRPAPLTLVARDDKILLIYPDLKKASLYHRPAGGRLLDRITGLTNDPEAFQRQYEIEVQLLSQGGIGRWIKMTMEPKSARQKRFFKRLEVKIDLETWLPNEIAILEAKKDWTVISLSNLVENSEISEGLFRVEPPEGFQVQSHQGGRRP